LFFWKEQKVYIILKEPMAAKGRSDPVRPLQISAETAVKLAEALNVPLERLMHMPQHILLQKMLELSKQEEKEHEGSDKEKP
jgi:hypothetical protein